MKHDDLISRKQAIEALIKMLSDCFYADEEVLDAVKTTLNEMESAQPEIIHCMDCKYWNSCSCECREVVVHCQDYMVGDMETEAEHFCGYAKRRTDGQTNQP